MELPFINECIFKLQKNSAQKEEFFFLPYKLWVSHYSTDEQSELHTLTFYRLIVSLTNF